MFTERVPLKSIRRVAHLSAGLTALSVILNSRPANAQAGSPVIKINNEAAASDVKTTPLRDGISMIEGSGGNFGVFTGPDGKFMVDAGIAVSKPKIIAALAKISPAPVKYVIDTHWHWDHTSGNAWLHDEGAIIVGTPNTVKHMSVETRVDDWDYTFPPSPAGGIPTEVLAKRKTYRFNGRTIVVAPIAPAHTDGDLYVYFKQADVLFAGDLFWNGLYPFIDNEQGGSIDGMIRADDAILGMTTDKTIIVPGHGPVGNRKQLIEFRGMLASIRKNVAALKTQGKSLAEAVASKPTAAYDEKWGRFVIGPDLFTKIVYDGLK